MENREPKLMRSYFLSLLACLLVALGGCSKSETPAPPSAQADISSPSASPSSARPTVDPCSLLTSDEIKAIQGEAVESAQVTPAPEGELAVSQCFFKLPSFINSISLQVTQKKSQPGAPDAKQAWKKMFPPEKLQEHESARGQKKLPPRQISGLGEEALWTGGPAGGLFVLQGDFYIRISVGGADDEETKIRKSTALAELVLKRL